MEKMKFKDENQIEIDFNQKEEMDFKTNSDVSKENKIETIEEAVTELVKEFYKKKEKAFISFNPKVIYECYKKAHREWKEEKKTKEKNKNYIETKWPVIMSRNRPDFFPEKDWPCFVHDFHPHLTRIIVDHEGPYFNE